MKWIAWGLFLAVLSPLAAQDAGVPPGQNPSSAQLPSQLAQKKAALIATLQDDESVGKRLVDAFTAIPRELFLPSYLRSLAYDDTSLPVGDGQTFTAPSDLAHVLAGLDIQPTDRMLVYGGADGYVAAIASKLAASVYVVEKSASLRAGEGPAYAQLGIRNITIAPNGVYPASAAPASFDKIFVHGATQTIPQSLFAYLAVGGKAVVPVRDASGFQMVLLVERSAAGITVQTLGKGFYPSIDLSSFP